LKNKKNFKKELNNIVEKNNYINLLTAIYCYSTKTDVDAGKKVIGEMFNKSIEDLEKKLTAINNNIDDKK